MLTACIVDNKHDVNEIIHNHYKFLPKNTIIKYINDDRIQTKEHYSNFLKTKEFWEQFETEHILIFQHDSCLLKEGIEEFYEYDYIGASWDFEPYVGNGGLSLRKKSAMLNVLNNYNEHLELPEDMYFAYGCKALNLNIASVDVADKFSIETKFKLGSLGYHQIETYFTKEKCLLIKNQYLKS